MFMHPLNGLLLEALSAGIASPQIKVRIKVHDTIVPLRFRLASAKSSNPNGVSITESFGLESIYWGSIIKDTGKLVYTRGLSADSMAVLTALMERLNTTDIRNELAVIGKETGACCFCGLGLTNEGSVHYGYGPICAAKYGLPWSPVDFTGYQSLELPAPDEDF